MVAPQGDHGLCVARAYSQLQLLLRNRPNTVTTVELRDMDVE